MKKTHRNIIIILISIVLVFSGGLFFLGKHFALKPQRFKAFLEYALCNIIDEPVSIGQARLRFIDGVLVTIKDFRMGRPEVMHMDVDKLEVHFSPVKLLTGGSHALTLRFTQPQMTVFVEPFMKEEATDLSLLSFAEIKNGSIKAVYRGNTYLLHRINGQISPASITLSIHTMDGRASIYARKRNGKWVGKTEAGKLALDKLECGINGHVDITAGIEEQDNGINISLLVSADNIDLPGNGKIIPKIRLMVDFGGSGDHIQFREVHLTTDALNLSGIGNLDLTTGENLGDAFLNVKLGSNPTDYETLVEYLPSDLCPEWLNLLLLKQVRNGNLEVSILEYNGTIQAFNDDFYNNLYIKAALNGVSYGAGHNDDRITDVMATALFEKGNLSFNKITGRAGDSVISSVDLIFPDIAEDGLRLIVNADLDVKAKDFAKIWRAAMEPKDVFDLMAPLSNVTSGSIKAAVSYKDGFEGVPPQLMGAIHIDDCSFLWSGFNLENISGSASADKFGRPFTVNMSGKFNSLPITSLKLNLSDLLGRQLYDYTLITSGPDFDGVSLSQESAITIKGKGEGPAFKGDIAILINGFMLGDTEYVPAGNRINGSGKITGALWPESTLHMTDIRLPMGSAGINLDMLLKKIGGSIKMNGTINARQKGPPPGTSSQRSLMGGIDMVLAWGEGLPASGRITLDNMSVFLHDSLLSVNGPISVNGPLLSSKRLDITHGLDTKIILSGRLELKDRSNHFTGDISVDGFKVKPDESSGLQLPESLTGEANIRISHLNLMGFPFEKASMKADLNKDKLFLKSINCGGEYGALSGGAEFSKKKGNRFIFDVDLKNKGLQDFFSTIRSNKFLIDGYLRLKGRVHGTTDSINGKLVFSARDGHILKSSFLTRLFGALNFYKIIKSRNFNLREKRFSYNKILSSFDIKDNVVTFDDFYLDSNSIQLSAIGNYNIETKIIDSKIGVQPLETLDRAVSVIPVIGWVLTGEGKKLIVISFTATGDISEPEIDLAPASGLSQQASDTLIRILDLPERLIDKSGNIMPGLKK